MRWKLVRYVALVAAISLGGCALHGGTTSGDVRDHGTLTKEQIAENHFNTAYDAVEALRSNWLRVRGTDSFQSPSEVQVYVDDTKLGGTDTLREIAASTIYYMRFFDGVAATGRWGGTRVASSSSRRTRLEWTRRRRCRRRTRWPRVAQWRRIWFYDIRL